MPADLTYEEAAAVLYGSLLALHFLRRANLELVRSLGAAGRLSPPGHAGFVATTARTALPKSAGPRAATGRDNVITSSPVTRD
jgi:hypothetical protein